MAGSHLIAVAYLSGDLRVERHHLWDGEQVIWRRDDVDVPIGGCGGGRVAQEYANRQTK